MNLAPGGTFTDGFLLSATTPGNAALQARAGRARRSEDRARFHDRRAAGPGLSATPLCRAAAAGRKRHARRRRGGRVPARHGGGLAERQSAARLGRPGPVARARALRLWLSRADDQPGLALALCRRSRAIVAHRSGSGDGRDTRSRDRPYRRAAAFRRQLRRMERYRRYGAVARRLCRRFSDPRQGARQERARFRDQSRSLLAARLCPPGAHRDRGPAGIGLCPLCAGAGEIRRSRRAAVFLRDADGAIADPARQGADRRGARAIRRYGTRRCRL